MDFSDLDKRASDLIAALRQLFAAESVVTPDSMIDSRAILSARTKIVCQFIDWPVETPLTGPQLRFLIIKALEKP